MKDIIFNPIFKDTCIFLKTAAQTNGEYSAMEVMLGARGGNPLHRHTAFTETFTVLEGELGLVVNGRNRVLRAGERVIVQKGEPHRFYNPGTAEARFHLQFTPGHTGAERMLRIVYGLARDGETDGKGIPKSLLTTALLLEMGDSGLPGMLSVFSPVLRLLAAYARRKGIEQRLVDKYCVAKTYARPVFETIL
jgi:quercetin dioxygenase-like cupin family protein